MPESVDVDVRENQLSPELVQMFRAKFGDQFVNNALAGELHLVRLDDGAIALQVSLVGPGDLIRRFAEEFPDSEAAEQLLSFYKRVKE